MNRLIAHIPGPPIMLLAAAALIASLGAAALMAVVAGPAERTRGARIGPSIIIPAVGVLAFILPFTESEAAARSPAMMARYPLTVVSVLEMR